MPRHTQPQHLSSISLLTAGPTHLCHSHNAMQAAARRHGQLRQTDSSALREGHRFIRTAEDDASDSLPVRLAKKYYDRLFKEYCIADLSRYKESKIGMRWVKGKNGGVELGMG